MRIYNGTDLQVDMPLGNNQRIQISPKSVSGTFMPNNEFLSLLVTSYDYSEISLIVSGPFEINMCSQISTCAGFITQSLEEAIERFNPKSEEAVPEPEKSEGGKAVDKEEEEIDKAPVDESQEPKVVKKPKK